MNRKLRLYLGLATAVLLAGAALWIGLAVANNGAGARQPHAAGPDGSAMTLHLLIGGPATSRLPAPERDFVRQAIERKFNVRLSVTYTEPGNDYETKIAALLSANDPPDMWLELSADGGAQHALDNVLADMTYYVTPEKMPHYFKYWMNESELRQYQFHNKFARAPIPYDKSSYRSYYIRKDWLDKLGLDVPDSYERYYNVLRAFTFNDPDGNGRADTYGFTTAGNGSRLSTDWPEYVKNGLLYPAYYADNRLIDMQMDSKVEQVVTDILRAMGDGVVDPDWFLNKGRQHIDKAVQGKVGIVLGDTLDFAFDANPDSLQSRSRAINPAADWVPFNPFGKQAIATASTPQYPFVYANNAAGLNPEKLERISQILDWLSGEEGFILTHYGLENVHYTRKGSTLTLIPAKIDEDIVQNGDFLKIWDFFTPDTPHVLGLTVIDPRRTERDRRIADTLGRIPVYGGLGTTLTPPLGISVEAMRARQNELQVKMVFADKSAKRWPEYREQIMTGYNGNVIFRQYEEKIRQAQSMRPAAN
ncbi:extracellular solute-binding protein [Paenibacillus hodogayensis]|uniref:Extracellular solute-binding protein n=1 Tax=Paenibacillus hodogayensis TaxID=279208 RepID=A0ABV5W4A9_9BACL